MLLRLQRLRLLSSTSRLAVVEQQSLLTDFRLRLRRRRRRIPSGRLCRLRPRRLEQRSRRRRSSRRSSHSSKRRLRPSSSGRCSQRRRRRRLRLLLRPLLCSPLSSSLAIRRQ